jgi:hypothetical protein
MAFFAGADGKNCWEDLGHSCSEILRFITYDRKYEKCLFRFIFSAPLRLWAKKFVFQ